MSMGGLTDEPINIMIMSGDKNMRKYSSKLLKDSTFCS